MESFVVLCVALVAITLSVGYVFILFSPSKPVPVKPKYDKTIWDNFNKDSLNVNSPCPVCGGKLITFTPRYGRSLKCENNRGSGSTWDSSSCPCYIKNYREPVTIKPVSKPVIVTNTTPVITPVVKPSVSPIIPTNNVKSSYPSEEKLDSEIKEHIKSSDEIYAEIYSLCNKNEEKAIREAKAILARKRKFLEEELHKKEHNEIFLKEYEKELKKYKDNESKKSNNVEHNQFGYEKYGIVYCYTNPRNGNKYIGETNNEERRKRDHVRGFKNKSNNKKFYRMLRQEGIKCLSELNYEILYEPGPNYKAMERHYIKINNSVRNGYNDK